MRRSDLDAIGSHSEFDQGQAAGTAVDALDDIAIFELVKACHARMSRRLENLLIPHGLTSDGYLALMALCESSDPMRQLSALCRQLYETRTNMTRLCDQLVNKGWMRRTWCTLDRRRVIVSLTEEGRALIEGLSPVVQGRLNELFGADFSGEQRGQLRKLLARLNSQALQA